MYDYLNRECNPFPPVADVVAPNVVCTMSYPGAAYANVGDNKEWHVDFLVSNGDVLIACNNVMSGAYNYSITRDNGTVTLGD